jgi:hypothetical protein
MAMDTKLNDIKSLFEPEGQFDFSEMDKLGNGLDKLNDKFKEQGLKNTLPFKSKPGFRKGQVWLVDTSYLDYYGRLMSTNYPFLVVIVDASGQLEGESFCRVQPITPFVEYVANDDFVYNEPDILGFPFLVETWNEQPILSEMLSYSVGYFDYEISTLGSSQNISLTKEQEDFRMFEVDNSAYLRHSVLSYLTFLEERQTSDTGVIININDRVVFPKLFVNDVIVKDSYAIAAKTKVDNQNKYFELTDSIGTDSFKIRIKRNDSDFVISVFAPIEFKLKTRDGKSLIPRKANDRIIFTDVNPGLYFFTDLNNKLITIRLK